MRSRRRWGAGCTRSRSRRALQSRKETWDDESNAVHRGGCICLSHGKHGSRSIALAQWRQNGDCVRIVVYVTDMFRFRPLVNKVQEELWGAGPYPPRTIIEVHRLNGDDICEVEGTFYARLRK